MSHLVWINVIPVEFLIPINMREQQSLLTLAWVVKARSLSDLMDKILSKPPAAPD